MRSRIAAVGLLLAAVPARAGDIFEIQVYDSETADPLQVGAEVHFNHFAVGGPADGTERQTDKTTHLTLEPHIGIASWCEAGAYFVSAFRPDGTFDFVGLKARFKMRVPWRFGGVLGLALNQELSSSRTDYEAEQFGWEIRPVIDADWRYAYVSLNPILDVPLGGVGAGVPGLEPSLKGFLKPLPWLGVGAEYYADFGPLTQLGQVANHTHRVFAALDLEWKWGRQDFELNLAVGYGLQGADKWIAKLIFAIDVEPAPPPPPTPVLAAR
ncbi:MAG: hypothetical protein ACOZQL_22580 [Myxococcota bacterium]